MAFVFRLYGRALQQRPVLTNSLSACVLYGASDCLAQTFEKRCNVQSPGKAQYNYERTARLCVFGLFVAGPVLTHWYSLLHRMTSVFRYEYVAVQSSSSGWLTSLGSMYQRSNLEGVHKQREILVKVALDQFLFTAPFLHVYLMSMSLLEGKSPAEGIVRCRQNFHDAWFYCLTFWVPAQTMNFAFVPGYLTPLTVNMFSLVWNAFLSVYFHHRDYSEHGAEQPNAKSIETQIATLQAEEQVLGDALPGVKKTCAAAGRLLQSCTLAAFDFSETLARLASRASTAKSAALSSWCNTETESLVGEEPRDSSTSRAIQDLRWQLSEKDKELTVLRRTVAGQAVRIQTLVDTASTAGRDDGKPYVGVVGASGEEAAQLRAQLSRMEGLEEEAEALRRTVAAQAIRLGELEEQVGRAAAAPAAAESPPSVERTQMLSAGNVFGSSASEGPRLPLQERVNANVVIRTFSDGQTPSYSTGADCLAELSAGR